MRLVMARPRLPASLNSRIGEGCPPMPAGQRRRLPHGGEMRSPPKKKTPRSTTWGCVRLIAISADIQDLVRAHCLLCQKKGGACILETAEEVLLETDSEIPPSWKK